MKEKEDKKDKKDKKTPSPDYIFTENTSGVVACCTRCTYSLSPDERHMLDAYPSLQSMYSADDGNTEVFYFKNATATFSSFIHEPEVEKF